MLARFRPDPATVSALDAIDGDTDDQGYPTIGPGVVTADWRKRRMIGCGQLTGMFFVPALTKSLAALRNAFMGRAAELGVPDVDAAAVRLARPRALTQEISQWAYKAQFDTPPGRFDGVQFQSRHSDDQTLWAIYERDCTARPGRLITHRTAAIDWDNDDLRQAMEIRGLTWG